MFPFFCALRETSLLQEKCLNTAQSTGCLLDLNAFSNCLFMIKYLNDKDLLVYSIERISVEIAYAWQLM